MFCQNSDAEDGVGEQLVVGVLALQNRHQDVKAAVSKKKVSQEFSRPRRNMLLTILGISLSHKLLCKIELTSVYIIHDAQNI
jgi:hypothetical protein